MLGSATQIKPFEVNFGAKGMMAQMNRRKEKMKPGWKRRLEEGWKSVKPGWEREEKACV